MDSITNTASDFVTTFGGTWDGTNPLVVAVPFAVLAFSAWVVEQRRKYGTSMGHALAEELLPAYKWLSEMRRFAPEVLALALVGLVSSILVCTGKHMGAPIPESDQVWQVITREWPILMTADTLLGLQAMFRLVFLLSAACRAGAGHSAPLTKEAAAFMFLAATMRVILLALSPADVFYLDGPLGGKLNLAVEVLAVPLLLYLAQSVLRDGYRSGCMFACGTLCALWLAHCHQLHVADPEDWHLDMLFTFGHMLELCAAMAVILRTATLWVAPEKCDAPSAGFVHACLPVQQFLSAYFMLLAFSMPLEFPPELVRAGHPLEVLRLAGVAQVFMYLLAAVLHFTASPDVSDVPEMYIQV